MGLSRLFPALTLLSVLLPQAHTVSSPQRVAQISTRQPLDASIQARTIAALGVPLHLRGGNPDGDPQPHHEVDKTGEAAKQNVGNIEGGLRSGLYSPSKERPGAGELIYERFLGKEVHVKVDGGTECRGMMKAFDAAGNMILDDTVELLFENEDDPATRKWTGNTRKLGYVIMIGRNVKSIMPVGGFREIPNPFPDSEPDLE